MSETRMVPLSKVKDNPWRDRMRNPIVPERVESIAASIDKTGRYWLGTYGREVKGGFVELAFGHHRYEAAKAQGLKEIPITIEPFTDGEMLVWMAQENVRGEMPVVIEAVAAAVRALGQGDIEVPAPAPNTRKDSLRYAPSFVAGKGTVPTVGTVAVYTVESLAAYLGFIKKATGKAKDSVYAAMGTLERAEIASREGGKAGVEKALKVERSFSGMKVNDAIKALSDIKGREAKIKEHAEKSAADIAAEKAKQEKLAAEIKARQAQEKKEHEELLSQRAAAVAEENAKKAKRIADEICRKAEAAEAKAEADKIKMAALDANVEAKKAAAREQRKEDEYLPVRREADRIIHILERRDLAEDLKALSRRPLTLKDRERVWEAIDNLAGWLTSWAAVQFSEPVKAPKLKRRTK